MPRGFRRGGCFRAWQSHCDRYRCRGNCLCSDWNVTSQIHVLVLTMQVGMAAPVLVAQVTGSDARSTVSKEYGGKGQEAAAKANPVYNAIGQVHERSFPNNVTFTSLDDLTEISSELLKALHAPFDVELSSRPIRIWPAMLLLQCRSSPLAAGRYERKLRPHQCMLKLPFPKLMNCLAWCHNRHSMRLKRWGKQEG